MKKGINLWSIFGWSYKGEPPLEDIFKRISDIGFDGVEFVYDDGLLDPDRISKEARRKYLEVCESLGLEICSVATGVFWRYNLGSPDEKVRRRGFKYLTKGIELAYDLEAPVLLVVPAVAIPEVPYSQIYETAIESLKKASRWAEDYGVTIGVENVWNRLLYSPMEFRRFIDSVGSPYVKAYLDIANVVNYNHPEHWILELKGRIACVHAKDFDLKVGNITGFRHLLKGSVDWPKMVKLLKEVGYDYYLVLETPPEFDPELKQPRYPEDGYKYAKYNLQALKRILGEK